MPSERRPDGRPRPRSVKESGRPAWTRPRPSALLAAAALAVFLATGAKVAAVSCWSRLTNALEHCGESALEARRRSMGAAYADGIEAIKKALPEAAEYLLVEREPDGSHCFVAYDLAPRRPWLPGPRPERAEDTARRGRPPGSPALVVIANGANGAPRLVSADDFFAGAAGP